MMLLPGRQPGISVSYCISEAFLYWRDSCVEIPEQRIHIAPHEKNSGIRLKEESIERDVR